MKKSFNLRIFTVLCILVSVFSCKDLSVDSTNLIQPSDGTFDKISLEEAQNWYASVLLKTPRTESRARTNAKSSGHPTEKEGNFKAAYSLNLENSTGNIVVAPLYYKGMEKVVYYAGEDAKGGSPKKEDIDRKAGRFQNNLIIYKQKDGRTEACVQRIIAYDSKSKKKDEVIKWKQFSGEVQYFDWNENFLFGFVMKKGEMTGRISSISSSAEPQPNKKNARTNCSQYQVTSTCFSYYACTRNPTTGALENCSEVTVTNDCYVTNITCIDTSDPNLGYSIPPWMGGSGISPNNPAVAGVWDRGETINLIHNNPFSLLRTPDCPENVADWVGLARFVPPIAVRTRAAGFNTQYGMPQSYIQYLGDAEGLIVNCDYFSIKINNLPTAFSNNPGGFLEYIRTHINNFVDTGLSSFNPHPEISGEQEKWLGQNGQDPVGSIVYIDIPGDDGSVVTSEKTSQDWTFSTIKEPFAGYHPVSGNRMFGYVANSDGSYTYYTKGIDRVQSHVDEVVGQIMNFQRIPYQFVKADELWRSFTSKIGTYVRDHGGQPGTQQSITKRPDWYDVQDVLNGKKPISSINCP